MFRRHRLVFFPVKIGVRAGAMPIWMIAQDWRCVELQNALY